MLVMAALTAGLFWGWLYWKTGSLVPCILSHAFWTVAVFILWPLTPGVRGGRKRVLPIKKAGLLPAFWCRLFTAP